MKKLVLVRFGQVRPIPAVTEALKPHMLPGAAVALPFPGAVVTIMDTNSNVEDIAKDVHATGVNFLIYEANEDGTLPAEVMVNLSKFATVANSASLGSVDPTLDQVIEKMRREGRESLTAREIQILENGLKARFSFRSNSKLELCTQY